MALQVQQQPLVLEVAGIPHFVYKSRILSFNLLIVVLSTPWLSPVQDALPPVPLLDSSDALDVVVAAPPRGPPASSVAGVSGPPPVHPGPVLFHVGVAAAGPGVSV